ncbi:MAG TPA: gamma-glutamylcyclotransferase [Solirubrobacteraceae bacterium]|nr:gamma-glutamylcyclotransferase [Solirubrobacteraceae bacterium]
MFLNGGGMRGGPVHDQIAGVPLIAELRTAPKYRFYSVRDEFPALVPAASGGAAIIGELYDVPIDMLHRSLLPAEPRELELGTIELEDGSVSFAMLLRSEILERRAGIVEITKHGGWRAYRDEGTG